MCKFPFAIVLVVRCKCKSMLQLFPEGVALSLILSLQSMFDDQVLLVKSVSSLVKLEKCNKAVSRKNILNAPKIRINGILRENSMKMVRQDLHKCNRGGKMEEKHKIKMGSIFPLSSANGRATKRKQQSLKITERAYEKWKQTEEINNFLYNRTMFSR